MLDYVRNDYFCWIKYIRYEYRAIGKVSLSFTEEGESSY